ncbi:MAG TPA: hypothetical protein PLX66_01230 [Bacilli bacterium]|nr:hypothetical protein [Bacilli bacterium]
MEKFLMFLDNKMIRPEMYGWFHIMFLIILVGSILLIKFKYHNLSNKNIKYILLIYSIVCLLFEVYKQINFSFNYDSFHTW